MTPSDARAFSFAATVILAASVARLTVEMRRSGPDLAWDTASALPELLEISRAEEEREAARRTPLEGDERLNPNTASADQLDRLPGVGPSTALAIVAARERDGPFAAPEDLLSVRGVGPATLARVRDHLELASRPATRGPLRDRSARVRPDEAVVDLNSSGALELQRLPGVGPALSQRILEARSRLGSFRSVDQLVEVRGIGAATVERLRPLVTVRR